MTRNEAKGLAEAIVEADTKAARIAASNAFMKFWESVPNCAERVQDHLSMFQSRYEGVACDKEAAPLCAEHLRAREARFTEEREALRRDRSAVRIALRGLATAFRAAEDARAAASFYAAQALEAPPDEP